MVTIVGAFYNPAALVIVVKGYDERFSYKFVPNHPRSKIQSLAQMLWKYSKYSGIGVAKYGNKFYVDC
uniref:SCP domain-containing protein n=1 Tax=Strongyloides venezuelensis TaxID=75913 RepID=A0A0K0EUT9_STRVS